LRRCGKILKRPNSKLAGASDTGSMDGDCSRAFQANSDLFCGDAGQRRQRNKRQPKRLWWSWARCTTRRSLGGRCEKRDESRNGLVRFVPDRPYHSNAYTKEQGTRDRRGVPVFLIGGYYDALEVGPMLASREGNVLDQRDIRRIQETRTSRPTAVAKPDPRRSFWGALVG